MPPPVTPASPVQPPKPRSKPAGPPPQPVPVRHSTAFILKQRKQDGNANPDASASNKPKRVNDEPFTGNAVQYWLKKADESLDEIEERPTETAKALYEVSKEVSKSPVGTATAKGVELVAKLSLMAGKEAVKVAVPAAGQVAKWAVAQGARAAMGAVQNSVKSGLAGDKKAKLGDGQQAKENGKDAPK